jgi:hypothetical protein
MRICTVPIGDSGIRWPAFPTKVKSVIRLGSSRAFPAERAMTCAERISSRTSVILARRYGATVTRIHGRHANGPAIHTLSPQSLIGGDVPAVVDSLS